MCVEGGRDKTICIMGPMDSYSGCNVSNPGVNWIAIHTNTFTEDFLLVFLMSCLKQRNSIAIDQRLRVKDNSPLESNQ